MVDEHPRDTSLEALAKLKPAFRDGGTVTAGNSSGINDGAAAVVMMRRSEAARRSLDPRLELRGLGGDRDRARGDGLRARIGDPAGARAGRAGVSSDVDRIELNEAFAAQAVAVIRDTGLDEERVNPSGGAIAFGHPVGATGAILTVKLMHALERTGERTGVVTMCIGGGQGLAAVFRRP